MEQKNFETFDVKVEKDYGEQTLSEKVVDWVTENAEKLIIGIYSAIIVVCFAWLGRYMKNIKLQNKLLRKIVDRIGE